MNARNIAIAAVCLFVAVTNVSTARGNVISITNPSFNATPPLGGPGTFTSDLSTVSGWTSGVAANFSAGVENAGANISPNDGSTLYLNFKDSAAGTATQTLSATEMTATYTLSAMVGNRSDRSSTAPTMSLLDNGVAIAPTTSSNPLVSGTLSLWTQTYVIPAGDGGTLGIRFSSGDGQANEVDNVSLTATPEPSTLVLGGLGLVGLLVAVRRRKV